MMGMKFVEHSGRNHKAAQLTPTTHQLVTQSNNAVIPAGYEPLPWSTDILLVVPSRAGRFRGTNTSLEAETDAEAVNAWLSSKSKESPNTREKYLREAERLLLWAGSKNKVLSDLTSEDFDGDKGYAAFLGDPTPRSVWVADKRFSKKDEKWRPFIGPLSRESRFQSLSVVYSMLCYLNRKGWLTVVALDAPRAPKSIAENTEEVRALSPNQVEAIRNAVSATRGSIKRSHLRFLVELLLATGARTSDLVSASMRDIQPEVIEGKTFMIWRVVGKGNKPRAIPLNLTVIKAMQDFRLRIGLPLNPDRNEPPYPIAMSIRGLQPHKPETFRGVTRQSVYSKFQVVYKRAAKILVAKGLQTEAIALQSATTHTYRHTALKTLADATNGDMRKVMKMAGHTSLSTSGRYTGSTLAELAEVVYAMDERSQ